MSKIEVKINSNNQIVNAEYCMTDIKELFIPFLYEINKLYLSKHERIIIFLAAPPGVGKTTLSIFLEKLAKKLNIPLKAVGIDGFHYHNNYLNNNYILKNNNKVKLSTIKGSYETFNVDFLKSKLNELKIHQQVMWPIYNRKIHDVDDEMIIINKPIVLLEGNWLLFNKDNWENVYKLSDYSIFIESGENEIKDRLINRKISGGLSKNQAIDFYNNSDSINIHEVLSYSKNYNEKWFFNGNHYFKKGEIL